MSGVRVEALHKSYRTRAERPEAPWYARWRAPRMQSVAAVDGLSFRIEAGERVAFVGRNGAGKSTTIKLLSGVLHPDGGSATVAGLVPWRDRRALAYRIGAVFGQRSQLWYELPVRDSFELLRHAYDLRGPEYAARRSQLCEQFGVGPLLSKPVRQLSLGERMRCEIVASLLHAPEILFLDEPTIGLDVAAKATIREVLRDEAQHFGRTLLLTSHDTADMERVCDRILVIHDGKLLLDEPLSRLRQRFIRTKRVTLRTAEPNPKLACHGAKVVRSEPHCVELEVDVQQTSVEALLATALSSAQIQDLTIEDPPLDAIVQAIYASAASARELGS